MSRKNDPSRRGEKESDLDDFKIITRIIAYFINFI
jgi:hypothetical protein